MIQWTSILTMRQIENVLGKPWVMMLIEETEPAKLARFCECRSVGAWDACDKERYAAYRSLALHCLKK